MSTVMLDCIVITNTPRTNCIVVESLLVLYNEVFVIMSNVFKFIGLILRKIFSKPWIAQITNAEVHGIFFCKYNV